MVINKSVSRKKSTKKKRLLVINHIRQTGGPLKISGVLAKYRNSHQLLLHPMRPTFEQN